MVGGGTGLSISLKKCKQRILYKRTPDSPSRENKAALKGSTVKTLYIFSLSFGIACARRSLMVIDSNQAQDFANLCSIFSIDSELKDQSSQLQQLIKGAEINQILSADEMTAN